MKAVRPGEKLESLFNVPVTPIIDHKQKKIANKMAQSGSIFNMNKSVGKSEMILSSKGGPSHNHKKSHMVIANNNNDLQLDEGSRRMISPVMSKLPDDVSVDL